MAEILMSEAEKVYILHGIQDNLRVDGRGCDDYRVIEVETDVVSNSSGSARLRLANTDVLVGVKAEIGEPAVGRPDEGRLEFFVDCSANATPEFEGRGGEDLATSISSTLARAYSHPQCLDLAALCIIPRQKCWVLYVDVLLLECGGNLFDAVSIAVKAALYNTRVPSLTVNYSEQGDAQLDVSDDPYDCKRLDVSNSPCLVTLNKVGSCHIVDASMHEESCSLASLLMAVTASGTVTALKKQGAGSVDPESIYEMMETGKRVGQMLNAVLLQRLQDEEKQDKPQRSGFLR